MAVNRYWWWRRTWLSFSSERVQAKGGCCRAPKQRDLGPTSLHSKFSKHCRMRAIQCHTLPGRASLFREATC